MKQVDFVLEKKDMKFLVPFLRKTSWVQRILLQKEKRNEKGDRSLIRKGCCTIWGGEVTGEHTRNVAEKGKKGRNG